jgi:hypothetical protein
MISAADIKTFNLRGWPLAAWLGHTDAQADISGIPARSPIATHTLGKEPSGGRYCGRHVAVQYGAGQFFRVPALLWVGVCEPTGSTA